MNFIIIIIIIIIIILLLRKKSFFRVLLFTSSRNVLRSCKVVSLHHTKLKTAPKFAGVHLIFDH